MIKLPHAKAHTAIILYLYAKYCIMGEVWVEIGISCLHQVILLWLTILQHINGLAKNISVNSTLELAEALCRQLGNCPNLPDDLKSLVVRPQPMRLESIAETETIVCEPNSSAVPTKQGESS